MTILSRGLRVVPGVGSPGTRELDSLSALGNSLLPTMAGKAIPPYGRRAVSGFSGYSRVRFMRLEWWVMIEGFPGASLFRV